MTFPGTFVLYSGAVLAEIAAISGLLGGEYRSQ